MTKLLSLAAGWKGYAAVAALCFLAGASGTWRVMSWHEAAQQTQALVKTVTRIQYRDRVTEKVVTKYLTVKAKAAEDTRNRIEDIPNHVSPEADAACSVSLGTVRVWNDAVHGPVPDAASGADDAPSGLACSDLAKAHVENSGTYDQTAAQLTALQDWIRQQQALSENN
jgi:hypothetical protein